jgi:hypothetical protein
MAGEPRNVIPVQGGRGLPRRAGRPDGRAEQVLQGHGELPARARFTGVEKAGGRGGVLLFSAEQHAVDQQSLQQRAHPGALRASRLGGGERAAEVENCLTGAAPEAGQHGPGGVHEHGRLEQVVAGEGAQPLGRLGGAAGNSADPGPVGLDLRAGIGPVSRLGQEPVRFLDAAQADREHQCLDQGQLRVATTRSEGSESRKSAACAGRPYSSRSVAQIGAIGARTPSRRASRHSWSARSHASSFQALQTASQTRVSSTAIQVTRSRAPIIGATAGGRSTPK